MFAGRKSFEAEGSLKVLGQQFHGCYYDGASSKVCRFEATLPTFPVQTTT